MESQKAASKTYCHIHQVFCTQDELEEWLEEEESDDDKVPGSSPRKYQGYASVSDDSSGPDVDVKGTTKVDHGKNNNQAHRVRKRKEKKGEEKAMAKKNPPKPDKRSQKSGCSHDSKKRHNKKALGVSGKTEEI
jgi:hypothetical protein